MKILIADDHPVFRRGLKQLIYDSFEDILIDEAADSRQALKKIRSCDYDIVLLDVAMPGRSGIEVLEEAKMEAPGLPILILSAYPEEQYAIRAIKYGASGYLTKVSLDDELIEAIKTALKGKKYITASLAERLAFALEDAVTDKPHESLSTREFQVMCMLASGKSIQEISEDLTISNKTVSTYRVRTLEKMNFKNTAEIIRYALKHDLAE